MAYTEEAKLLIDVTGAGVVTVTLNRPDIRNAFDEELIGELSDALDDLARDATLRALVLQGQGKIFSAGADLNYMARAARACAEENHAQARALATMLNRLDSFPRPTLALVQGAAIAGGLGLVAACDVVIAVEGAVFSLSEVRLGIAPAVVAPYVIRAIGPRAARRYFVSAERFGTDEARRIGLVSEVVEPDQLEVARDRMLAEFAKGGPNAQAAAKAAVDAFAATDTTQATPALLRAADAALVEAERVDFQLRERDVSDSGGRGAVGHHLGVVAHPA